MLKSPVIITGSEDEIFCSVIIVLSSPACFSRVLSFAGPFFDYQKVEHGN